MPVLRCERKPRAGLVQLARTIRIDGRWHGPGAAPSGEPSTLEGGRDVGELLDQPAGVREAAEAVMLVEARGGFIDRVDDGEPRGDRLGGCDDASESIGQQCASDAVAVQRLVERQPGDEDGRYLPWSSAAERPGQIVSLQEMCCERVVRDDGKVAAMPDECAGGSPCLRCGCVPTQPAVKLSMSAGEGLEPVRFAQRLGTIRRLGYRRTDWRALAAARASAGSARGGSSSALSSWSK